MTPSAHAHDPASAGSGARSPLPAAATPIAAVVGFLVCVEVASGFLQGYYTPLFTDIARNLGIRDAEVNWFEAAQLAVSAVVVPVLAKLGDLRGHRRVLLASTAVTALAAWGVALAPSAATFALAWALLGVYTVWLPLEVSIVHRRTHGDDRRTRLAAAVLVAALEAAVIASALAAGALAELLPMRALLSVPAAMVTVAGLAVWFGVDDVPPSATGDLDLPGTAWLSVSLVLVMGGLALVRALGVAAAWPWLALAAGLAAGVVFVRTELAATAPLVDLRVLGRREQWPIQATAALFGASVLGAQIPLSTYARTDPASAGHGLGQSASGVSLLIGGYVVALLVGALAVPLVGRLLRPRLILALGTALVAVGYALFLPRHTDLTAVLVNMLIAGVGSGMLVALLPAAAAQHAPAAHTGVVTGMTNAVKTVGGAFASCAYGLALAAPGSTGATAEGGHAPLSGYLLVWALCAGTAVVATMLLLATSTRAATAPAAGSASGTAPSQ